jgi:hypothetical protein
MDNILFCNSYLGYHVTISTTQCGYAATRGMEGFPVEFEFLTAFFGLSGSKQIDLEKKSTKIFDFGKKFTQLKNM